MTSVARPLRRRMYAAVCRNACHWAEEKRRDALEDAGKGSRKGVSMSERKSRCTVVERCSTIFQNLKRLTEGFKPGASSCGDDRGNLLRDAQRMLRLWRHHFFTLLRGAKNNKAVRSNCLPAKLFKAGSEELVRRMHRIWLGQHMPSD